MRAWVLCPVTLTNVTTTHSGSRTTTKTRICWDPTFFDSFAEILVFLGFRHGRKNMLRCLIHVISVHAFGKETLRENTKYSIFVSFANSLAVPILQPDC